MAAMPGGTHPSSEPVWCCWVSPTPLSKTRLSCFPLIKFLLYKQELGQWSREREKGIALDIHLVPWLQFGGLTRSLCWVIYLLCTWGSELPREFTALLPFLVFPWEVQKSEHASLVASTEKFGHQGNLWAPGERPGIEGSIQEELSLLPLRNW